MPLDIYERIASFVPKSIQANIQKELNYMDINIEEKNFLGFIILFCLALSFGLALNAFLLFKIDFLVAFATLLVGSSCGGYFWLSIAAESKGKFVEKILPDALQLIASNIKSGLTTERALFASARPEFGPLEIELKRASQKILGGERIEAALLEIPEKIHSIALERTMWLISKGISSGGQIADLLLQLSDDLREQKGVEEETKANISMYIMLILFSAAIGAPILFGISSFIVEILSKQMASLPTISPETLTMGAQQMGKFRGITTGLLGGHSQEISADFIILFSIVSLVVTSFFSSMIVGIINTGKEKNGLKYVPIMIIVSLVLFFLTRTLIGSVFSGLVGT